MNDMATDNNLRELGWDDTIEKDSRYELVPAGDYWFTVKSFARGRHNGSEKLPSCPKAELQLELTDGQHKTRFSHSLFRHSITEGLLCPFFTAIVKRKHGEQLRMNWQKVSGARGRCKVIIEPYEGRDYNKIARFYEYDPDKMTVPAAQPQTDFTAGSF
jgi:hypothetical protein